MNLKADLEKKVQDNIKRNMGGGGGGSNFDVGNDRLATKGEDLNAIWSGGPRGIPQGNGPAPMGGGFQPIPAAPQPKAGGF